MFEFAYPSEIDLHGSRPEDLENKWSRLFPYERKDILGRLGGLQGDKIMKACYAPLRECSSLVSWREMQRIIDEVLVC